MPARIHYDDDLFFLHAMVRTLESGMRLEIDADIFRDRILEDIYFIHEALMRLWSSLKSNTYLINRSNHLRSLRRTLMSAEALLERIHNGEFAFARELATFDAKLRTTRDEYAQVREEIDRILDQIELDDERVDVVSSAEIGFLLDDDGSEE